MTGAYEPADNAGTMLTALGLGFYLGWQLIGISPTLFAAPLPGVTPIENVCSYLSTALLIGLLAALGMLAYRRGLLLGKRWVAALATIGTSVGTAMLYAYGWLEPSGEPALPGVIVGRTLFCTSAGFVVLWGEALCRVRPAHLLACVAGGYAVAFGLCLVSAFLEPRAAMAFRVMLPLLSGTCLLVLRADLLASPHREAPTSEGTAPRGAGRDGARTNEATSPIGRSSLFGRTVRSNHTPSPIAALPLNVFLGIGLLGAIFTVANHLSESKTDVSTELYTLYAGVCAALAILAVARVTHGRGANFPLLYRLVTPLVIGCLLLTLVLQPGYQRYEALAIGFAWAFFRVFTWTLWAHVGARDVTRGACAFAVGQVILTLFGTLGELVSTVADLSSMPLAWAAAVIIFATVVTATFVMDEGSLARLFAGRPGSEAASGGQETPAPSASDESERVIEQLGLSGREAEIALLIASRADNAGICQQLSITESTLRTHLRNIYAKLDVHSRAELIERVRPQQEKPR